MKFACNPAAQRWSWTVGTVGVALLLLFALAWRHDPPTGRLVTLSSWPVPQPRLSELKPVGRVETVNGETLLTGAPVYFDVAPPTPFETVTVEAIVRPESAATVELSALATADGRYDRRAAYSQVLASGNWQKVSSGDLSLYQRRGEFLTVDDFLAVATTAALTYPTGVAVAATPAATSGPDRSYRVSARGAHRLFARVPTGESLRLAFSVQDMNRQVGADPIRLTVFRAGGETPLAALTMPDDGDAAEDWRAAAPRLLQLDWQPGAPGEYWLAFDASDDVFIRDLTTPLAEFGFLNRLYLGDEVGYGDDDTPASVLAAGRYLRARAMRAEAVQTIDVGGRGLALSGVGGAWAESTLAGATLVTAPRRGLVLTTDGRFSFGGEAPAAATVLDACDSDEGLADRGLDYVLARQGDVQRLGDGYYLLRATYRTSDLALTSAGAYRFAISATATDDIAAPVLARVRLTWQRPRASMAEWLRWLWHGDAAAPSGDEPARPDLIDFDEQIP